MYIYRENNIYNIYNTIKQYINLFDTIVIDSLPCLISDSNIKELQYDFKIFDIVKKIINICRENNCNLIIVNQMRFKKNGSRKTFGLRVLGLYYTKRIYIINNKEPLIVKDLHG